MAGLEMRYVFDDVGMVAQIDALIARGGDLDKPLDDIGQDMVTVTTRAFELSQSPEGVAWLPSAAATREGRKTLVDRGLRGGLMGSFSYLVGEAGVVYGTNILHAAFHQTGYSFTHGGRETKLAVSMMPLADAVITVPARPFIGASERELARWEGTLRDYLAGTPAGGAT